MTLTAPDPSSGSDDEDGTAEGVEAENTSGEEDGLEGSLLAHAEGFWGDEYDGQGFVPL